MPYLPSAQAWLSQSALLLQARPTTTRITTKYTLTSPTTKSKKSAKFPKSEPTTTASADTPLTTPPPTTRATLTLKTYDPTSGTTLKYETDKAPEVGRLISSLARLGRTMAGLPELKDDIVDVSMMDAHTVEGADVASGSGVVTPVPEGVSKTGGVLGGQAGGMQGGKKGKKKGKK